MLRAAKGRMVVIVAGGHDFSNQMSTHASVVEPLNLLKSTYRHTHKHTQLTLAFEGPAGLSSGYSQSSAAE